MKNNLKKIRMTELMLNAKEFAAYLGVDYTTYYGWESGKFYPRLPQAYEVAKKLNRKVDDIWHL